MSEIAAVVVAHNSADTIGACLEGILADPAARVCVVDNASDPRTAAICAALAGDGRVGYLDPGANLGYARAANLGLAGLAGTGYVAVVNPDVRLTRTLSDLIAVADPGSRNVVAGRLASPRDARGVNARPATTFRREAAKALLGSRAYRLPPAPAGTIRPVDQLDGALMVMSVSRWRELGGFDERFELYYEDVDMCSRIRANGACLLVNAPWGEHVGGHSFQRSSATAFVAQRVSRVRYARQWWRPAILSGAAVFGVTFLELAVRSLTHQSEGQRTRNRAARRVLAELHKPGSQTVLIAAPPPTHTQTPGKNER